MQKANASVVVILVQICNVKNSGALKFLMLLLKPFKGPKFLSSEGLKGVAGIRLRHYTACMIE